MQGCTPTSMKYKDMRELVLDLGRWAPPAEQGMEAHAAAQPFQGQPTLPRPLHE